MVSIVIRNGFLLILLTWLSIGGAIVIAAILNFPVGVQSSFHNWKLPSMIHYGDIDVSLDRSGADGMLYFIIRKLGHFFVYSFVSFFLMGMINIHKRTYKLLLVITSISTLATVDEMIQAFLPHRSALVMDVFVDITGGLHGIFIYLLYNLFFKFHVQKINRDPQNDLWK